jgi:DnaJ-class molecular chaperone
MGWSEKQDDVLRECSFRGAAFARDEIERRCGVSHTVHAVEVRASRIHCSLQVQTVCPECGAVGVVINKQTGLCRLCTERYHLEQERAFAEILKAERAAAEDSGRIAEARRERDAQRQRNSRTCRKYGLPSRRERRLG